MSASAAVLRHLRRQFGVAAPDAELLRGYVEHQDENAFRTLVERHGPMVLGTCRRRLGDLHAAEDAFQAVFLALARNASTVRRPEALAAWLYRAAMNVCDRVRATTLRRRAVEARHVSRSSIDPAH